MREEMNGLVIGLDSSTTATKAVAFDRGGDIAAQARREIPLSSPRPNYYEQDPEDWWASTCGALQDVAREVDPKRVAAIAVSNQRETFAALDENGKAVRPAIVWLDERCRDEVGPFSAKVGAGKIHRITGKPPDYAPVVYRLAWMKRHEPDILARSRVISDVHSYIVHRLAGRYVSSWASADPLGLFDIRRKKWSPAVLDALELREDRLPSTCPPGVVIGSVGEEASKATGLSTNTLVVAGGGDGQSAGLGVNALRPGRAYLNLGTAVVCGVFSEGYRVNKAFRTICGVVESGYYCECSLRAGMFSVDWLIRNMIGIDPASRPSIYRELEIGALGVAPGSDGLFYLPYLCGAMNPYWDMNARGAFIGLSSSHGRGHLYRAVLEGIAFEQSLALRAVEKATGSRVEELFAIGGGAASEAWFRIIADITGKTTYRPRTTEASGLGAGISAAVGAGWYGGFREAASGMTGNRDAIKPDAGISARYQALYRDYGRIYPALRGLERPGR
jgi:sugar (pentulose or hexulose) kinase